jgi:hypothetical protein
VARALDGVAEVPELPLDRRQLPLQGTWNQYDQNSAAPEQPVILEPSFYKYEDEAYRRLAPQWTEFCNRLLDADAVIVRRLFSAACRFLRAIQDHDQFPSKRERAMANRRSLCRDVGEIPTIARPGARCATADEPLALQQCHSPPNFRQRFPPLVFIEVVGRHSPVNHRAARTRHPHALALDARV